MCVSAVSCGRTNARGNQLAGGPRTLGPLRTAGGARGKPDGYLGVGTVAVEQGELVEGRLVGGVAA